jgi:hypothetical protein
VTATGTCALQKSATERRVDDRRPERIREIAPLGVADRLGRETELSHPKRADGEPREKRERDRDPEDDGPGDRGHGDLEARTHHGRGGNGRVEILRDGSGLLFRRAEELFGRLALEGATFFDSGERLRRGAFGLRRDAEIGSGRRSGKKREFEARNERGEQRKSERRGEGERSDQVPLRSRAPAKRQEGDARRREEEGRLQGEVEAEAEDRSQRRVHFSVPPPGLIDQSGQSIELLFRNLRPAQVEERRDGLFRGAVEERAHDVSRAGRPARDRDSVGRYT